MSVQGPEERLQVLEDVETIKKLIARFAFIWDSHDAIALSELFTEDAIWEDPGLGCYEGRDAIISFYKTLPGIVPFTAHYFTQPCIELEAEDLALGRWSTWCPVATAEGTARVVCGTEECRFKKVKGEWRIFSLKVSTLFNVAYEEGWGKLGKPN
jgi:ketosteroid isomerase-like protein